MCDDENTKSEKITLVSPGKITDTEVNPMYSILQSINKLHVKQ